MMKLLLAISNTFINTMGITQPSEKNAKKAAWFIFCLLLIVLALIVSIATLAIHFISRH
jgi:hypothetical protein